jgi:hypothetical protein
MSWIPPKMASKSHSSFGGNHLRITLISPFFYDQEIKKLASWMNIVWQNKEISGWALFIFENLLCEQ